MGLDQRALARGATMSTMLRVVVIFVLAAAPAIGSECPCKNRSAVSLVLLQYGDPTSDRPFAQTLAGFLEGGKAMRVRATPIHINPALRATNSLPGTTTFMNQHLDAIASMDPPPSGVILPLPNYPAIASKLSVLVSKGIPVISFGSGWSVVKNMANPPTLFHMGADEVATGKSAGGLAARIGGHRAMCLYDQSDDVALTDRCSGFARGFNTSCASTVDACPTQSLLIDSSDLTAMQIMLQDAIAANANLNVVVVSTGAIAAAVVRLIGNMALPYKIYVGCFISDQYTDALLASESLFFAVSRQEYLMGYLAATLLQYYVTTGQKFANPTISTGPVFLTPGYTAPKTASIDNVLVEQVVHGRAIDPFWGVYATGASEAARDVGLRFVNCDVAGSVCDGTRRTLTYRSPGNQFDLTTMATKLLTSASNAPNAMILSDPSTQVLGSTINQVVKTNGIPAVGVNAGGNDAESLGLLMFFGSNEPIAGQAAGKQLGIAGVTKALCVNHELGNSALTQRCQGLGTGLAAYRGVSDPTTVYTMLPISLTDVSGTATAITAALQNDPSINGVLVLGSAAVSSVLLPLQQAGWVAGHPSTDRVKAIGSFDLDGPLQAAIQAGYVLFTVLQQQHMQAYMPGIAMTLRSSTGLNLLESWILTGPSLMTNSSIAAVNCQGEPACPSSMEYNVAASESSCPRPEWAGDGWCDAINNVPGCYDGGDCCSSTCVSKTDYFQCGSDLYGQGTNRFNCLDRSTVEGEAIYCNAHLSDPTCVSTATKYMPAGVAAMFIALACTAIACQVLGWIASQRKTRTLFYASPPMLAASLAGGILAGVFALLTSVTQTASICTARAYLAPIAVTLALSPNTLKLFRFYKIFRNKTMKVVKIPNAQLLLGVAALLVADIVVVSIWVGASPFTMNLRTPNTCLSPLDTRFVIALVVLKAPLFLSAMYFSNSLSRTTSKSFDVFKVDVGAITTFLWVAVISFAMIIVVIVVVGTSANGTVLALQTAAAVIIAAGPTFLTVQRGIIVLQDARDASKTKVTVKNFSGLGTISGTQRPASTSIGKPAGASDEDATSGEHKSLAAAIADLKGQLDRATLDFETKMNVMLRAQEKLDAIRDEYMRLVVEQEYQEAHGK